MLVLRSAASTFARLGALPALQTDAIASITTVVACHVGTPNEPYAPYFLTPLTIDLARAFLLVEMSGPKFDTYVPGMTNCPGESVPSVPNSVTVLPCCCSVWPNCWALPALCHGRTTR